MLVYEKKRKMPIRQVILKEEGKDDDEEEKVEHIEYRSVQKYVPDWIKD